MNVIVLLCVCYLYANRNLQVLVTLIWSQPFCRYTWMSLHSRLGNYVTARHFAFFAYVVAYAMILFRDVNFREITFPGRESQVPGLD